MKRKTSLALLLCVLSGFILTGCNQSANNPPPSNTNAPAPAPSTNK